MKHCKDFELKNYTSFKIGGKAQNAFFPESFEEFVQLLSTIETPIILGGMSNLLISSSGIKQNIIITKKFSNFTITNDSIIAQAGAMGPLVSKAAKEHSLSGMEFMCGFPGTIGGIVTMNASAHKQAISDIFIEAKVFDLETKTLKTFNREDMHFDYRSSVLQQGNYVLLEAEFKLNPDKKELIEARMNANNEFRKEKQPNLSKPNCGSVFKNPQGDSAGRLLEAAGAKDLSVGGAKVFENHANFIINTNNATSTDVSQLMKKMYNKVNEKFGIELQPEVKFIGEQNEIEREIWNLWKQPLNK